MSDNLALRKIPDGGPMSLSTIPEVPITVRLGQLNEATATFLRQELNALIIGGCRDLVMDLVRVKSVDAVGLGVLCAAHTTLKREQGTLSLINASSELYTLFCRTGLSRDVTISTVS
jgi:anti-anti-sigma factor